MTSRTRALWGRAVAAGIAALALLAGCGGGDVGSGGTGSPVVGHAVGTVSGLGSVIVDGVRFDDRTATRVQETAPGTDSPADPRLGERVEVEFGEGGIASAVRVDATLVGPVDTVTAPGVFTVMGQTVIINADPSAGPVTQLDGYATATDVQAGDAVEVHGVPVPQGVQATRVERKSALPAYLRATGAVSELSGTRFKLGTLFVETASAVLKPAGSSLSNGLTVVVMGPSSSLAVNGSGALQLDAAQVRIKTAPAVANEAYASGEVSTLDTTARTFVIDHVRVDYSDAVVAPAGSTIAAGVYLRAQGAVLPNGTLKATALTILEGDSASEAELKGTILEYDAATRTFTVRDVRVDASAAQIEGCPATGTWDGLYAEVHGSFGSSGVVASELHCQGGEPAGSVVEREGTAGSVDLAAKTFVLTREGTSVTVRWTTQTYFSNVSAETLAGKRMAVEGVLESGVLVARKIRAED